MKKVIIITLLSFVSLSSLAQDRKDFFSFISSFNWSLSESEFASKYGNRIVSNADSLAKYWNFQENTYLLNDLKIGDYDCFLSDL